MAALGCFRTNVLAWFVHLEPFSWLFLAHRYTLRAHWRTLSNRSGKCDLYRMIHNGFVVMVMWWIRVNISTLACRLGFCGFCFLLVIQLIFMVWKWTKTCRLNITHCLIHTSRRVEAVRELHVAQCTSFLRLMGAVVSHNLHNTPYEWSACNRRLREVCRDASVPDLWLMA